MISRYWQFSSAFYFVLMLFLGVFAAKANAQNDPFDNTQRDKKPVETSEYLVAKSANQCHQQQAVLMPNEKFKQLKIIGILLSKQEKRILLQNEQGEVHSLKQGEFVATESYQLKQIGKTEGQFLTWKKDCSDGEVISVKL
ncbi:hypothetical protein A4G18_06370 [Pasteurellaceae bacterium Pebbles2]|nr:hypothetical protein [Pasteurellaceae bacterium Pebbles2]